jgi:hypothetical protein
MSLANLSRAYAQMRTERDDAVGEYGVLTDLVAGHILDKSDAAREWLEVIAAEHRKAQP